MGFHAVGSRGYGENTSVHSVAIATPATDGRMVINQWSNLFVTGGGIYEVKHLAEGLIYSSGQMQESVLGVAYNRPIGLMQTDVPSFSSRTILHTGVLKTAPLSPKIDEISVKKDELTNLKISLPDDQNWPTLQAGHFLYKKRLYRCSVSEGMLQKSGGSTTLQTMLQVENWNINQYYWNKKEYSVGQLYDMSLDPLIAHDLGLKSDQERDEFSFDEDKVRVYLYAEMPEEYFAHKDISAQQDGRVLYTFDLHIDQ